MNFTPITADGIESPTVVLDRLDSTSSSEHEPTVSPDPFRDVIHTEPAPDLFSLISEMIPYLVEHTSNVTSNISGNVSIVEQPPPLPSAESSSTLGNFIDFVLPQNSSNILNDTENNRTIFSHNLGNFSINDVTLTTLDPPIVKEDDSSIFSLDSVLDLFFNDDTSSSSSPSVQINFTTVTPSSKVLTSTRNTMTSTRTTTTIESTTKSLPMSTSTFREISKTTKQNVNNKSTTITTTITTSTDKDPLGLLKLAGCNIYGQMYRINRIIAELSSSCRECRCTEFGVQCKSLNC